LKRTNGTNFSTPSGTYFRIIYGSVILTSLGVATVPTLSEWTLAFLAILLGGLGVLATRVLRGGEAP
jgi:hypothetical protein